VVRAGLPILSLIVNDIYKPAPTDVSVRYDRNTFFVFSQILGFRLTHPTGMIEDHQIKDFFGACTLFNYELRITNYELRMTDTK
jgi:hypothetical protein